MKVVIVGGGIIGLSIARELKKTAPGTEVVVIERATPGDEASMAAGGILGPQFESEKPGPFLDFATASRAMWPKFAAEVQQESGLDVAYLSCGALQLAFTDDEVHALDAKVSWQQAVHLRATLLGAAELAAKEPQLSKAALAAAEFPDDHQLDPRLFLPALHRAATKAGVSVERATARALITEGGKVKAVELEGGSIVRGDLVVLAAGAWSGQLAAALIPAPARLEPRRGQMLELKVAAPPTQRLIKSSGGYVISRADGHVVVGSTMEDVGFDKSVTPAGLKKLLDAAMLMVPSLATASLTRTWAGLRPWTDDQLPWLGEGPAGLVLATGHFRNGILLAPITARVVGQLVRGERPTHDLRPFRYERPRA
ncbi:MAG: glycine oxidase ThiO [Myxococcaceae bacterium]